jgi:dynein heavy chain
METTRVDGVGTVGDAVVPRRFSQGGWFDRSNDLAFRKIIDIVFIASLGPPGGGRQDMTARFVRPFNVVGLAEMSDQSKAGIFETILGDFLSGFTPEISQLCAGLVQSTIDTFNNVLTRRHFP